MKTPIPPPGSRRAVAQFRVDGLIGPRTYERVYVDCGKPNCSKCGGRGDRHPSHGPYWYLCRSYSGRWTRIYLGKDLNTSRFVCPNGDIDWPAVRTAKGAPARSRRPTHPEQLDLVDQHLEASNPPLDQAPDPPPSDP